MTLNIIDIPRSYWRIRPPSRLQVVAAMVTVAIVAIVWALI